MMEMGWDISKDIRAFVWKSCTPKFVMIVRHRTEGIVFPRKTTWLMTSCIEA